MDGWVEERLGVDGGMKSVLSVLGPSSLGPSTKSPPKQELQNLYNLFFFTQATTVHGVGCSHCGNCRAWDLRLDLTGTYVE